MEDVDLQGTQTASEGTQAEPKAIVHTQEDLERIVKREKLEHEQKVRRELEAAHKAEIAALKAGTTQNLGGMNSEVDVDKIKQDVYATFQADVKAHQEKVAEAQHQEEMQRVADNYFSKLKGAKEKYSDFDEVMGDFEHEALPQLVYNVSGLDNAGDVMYHLTKNPRMLQDIDYWLRTMPAKGLKELQKLSDSIKETAAAQDEYEPTNPPLSETRPSNVGVASGRQGLEDLKRDPSLMF